MSPRAADESIRLELMEAAARILARNGPDALTTRRLASEVRTSTMAIYTHFAGMDDLRRAIRLEWFARLAAQLASIPRSADPVADLAAQGWAYFFSAIENEHLFRATVRDPFDDPLVAMRLAESFQVLVDSVQRCTEAGRLSPGDPFARALQMWMMGNGALVACLGGFIKIDDAIGHFFEMALSLLTTYGDDPDAARASIERGRKRMERRSRNTSRRPPRSHGNPR